MPTYTRAQLRDGVNAVANLTAGTYTFTLNNNSGNNYFAIEGIDGAKIFNSASISNLTGCSAVSSSFNAGFSVNGDTSNAQFNLVVAKIIPTSDIRFKATNNLVYHIGDPTASGSVFGIEASY